MAAVATTRSPPSTSSRMPPQVPTRIMVFTPHPAELLYTDSGGRAADAMGDGQHPLPLEPPDPSGVFPVGTDKRRLLQPGGHRLHPAPDLPSAGRRPPPAPASDQYDTSPVSQSPSPAAPSSSLILCPAQLSKNTFSLLLASSIASLPVICSAVNSSIHKARIPFGSPALGFPHCPPAHISPPESGQPSGFPSPLPEPEWFRIQSRCGNRRYILPAQPGPVQSHRKRP